MTQGAQVKAGRGRPKGQRKRLVKKPRKQAGGQGWLTRPLTGKQARRTARASVRAEYAPLERAIQGKLRGSRQREKQIGQWFNQLGTNFNEAAAQTDASYAQANSSVQANIRAAQEAARQNNLGVARGNADFAALTGADPAAFAQGTQEAASAANQRALTQTMAAAPIALGGANQAAYLRNLGLNARREGINQRGLEFNRRQEVKDDLRETRRDRGRKVVENFNELRDKEREYELKRRVFTDEKPYEEALREQSQLGLKGKKITAAAGNKQAGLYAGAKGKMADALVDTAKINAKGGGGEQQEGRRNAMATAEAILKKNGWPPTAGDWAFLERQVAKESEVSAADARWALRRIRRRAKRKRHGNRGIPGATQTPYAP